MKRIILIVVALAATGLLTSIATAGTINASATITATPDGSDFDYTITLTNTSGTGNDNIATFWFAWVPGEDFLATQPISVTNPPGWTDVITHFPDTPTNGYAIQYNAGSAADDLVPGNSLVFAFKSADTPAGLMGNSVFYPTTPVLTSFVYSQGPLQGDGKQFLVTFASVPEPSSLVLGVVGVVGSLALRRLRRGATA
jgi:PEP-CTERM motif